MTGALDTSVEPPGIRRCSAVVVVGPHQAGTSSVLIALRKVLPDNVFCETTELADGAAPAAVVFVTSAIAPLVESDCRLLDAAAAHTDLVIGAVSKIDVHRRWRDVLAADRELLAVHDGRFAGTPWVAVAAAPDLGAAQLDDLAEVLIAQLDGEQLIRRNRLRAWQFRLTQEAGGLAALEAARIEAGRQRRLARSERAITLRSQLQQARVALSFVVRNRCTALRAELQEDIAVLPRRAMPAFPADIDYRTADIVGEIEHEVTRRLSGIANALGLPDDSTSAPLPAVDGIGGPPLKSRRVETRLMMLLGAGFGLGVALTLSRIFADIAPGATVAGAAGCAVIGLAVTVWVIGMRGLLHDRAVLDRWATDVTAGLRAALDQVVATRVLDAETALAVGLAEQHEADTAAHARTRSTDVGPAIRRALEQVRSELERERSANSATQSRADVPSTDGFAVGTG